MTLDDLTRSQRRLLARLGGGGFAEDAIGREIGDLTDAELIEAHGLIVIGLVEIVEGWRGTTWFMMTGYCLRIIEEGLTE
ncbi:hypothetical protein [Aureimonas psammosilenae]|uniref:hypothetical protein n=1 Tax=Aureimonas psammosilenae TaxID=2495496 RepID=UPI0012609211|nr:hypothetical protein [Aureimonas psammosilenae]